jgi:hypothetical protein
MHPDEQQRPEIRYLPAPPPPPPVPAPTAVVVLLALVLFLLVVNLGLTYYIYGVVHALTHPFG